MAKLRGMESVRTSNTSTLYLPETEETSLITVKYDSSTDSEAGNNNTGSSTRKRWIPHWFRAEFKRVLHLSWSLFLISLFNYLLEPIALYFCGRLGENDLAAIALATSLMNITGLAVGLGLATACDTVFSQSFGSENKTEAGVYLIKGTIIILLFVFPCSAIHLNMETILLAIGQPPCVARLTGEFMQYFTISLPAVFLEEILMQYLRCQDYLALPLLVGLSSVVVCIACHYLLVTVLGYGIVGSSIAIVITFYVVATELLAYILVTKLYKASWRGWTGDVYQGWGAFLKLALAGFVMLALEWWVWEFSVVTAGWLGTTYLGAASIVLQITTINFQLPIGIGLAVNIRTGQLLGNKNPAMARKMVYIGSFLTFVQSIVVNGAVASLRYELPRLFTDDERVIEICATVLPISCLIALVDGQCGTLLGVLRGCGKQLPGSMIMIFGLTAVGLPAALLLQLYAQLNLVGFFSGLAIGVTIEYALILICVYRTDWHRMVYDAQIRAGVYTTETKYETFVIKEAADDSARKHSDLSLSRLNLKYREPRTKLSTKQLLMRRTLFVLFMIGTLVLGVAARLWTQDEMFAYNPCPVQDEDNITAFNITTSSMSPLQSM